MIRTRRFAGALAAAGCLLIAATADAETLAEAAARLRYEYRQDFGSGSGGPGELPFNVEASSDEGKIRSRATFLLENVDFDELAAVLGSAKGWCDSLLLHLNVKTCVFRDGSGRHLELYLGRKYYQEPQESVRIDFDFDFDEGSAEDDMRALLTADEGPYGTSEYVFILTAIKVPLGVYVELRLSNEEGYAGGLISLYFSTLGRSKVGFTQVGKTIFGNPEFVGGQIGAAERNVVRYMYALRVSLELGNADFMNRAEAWFDATEQYPRQLEELKRDSYLSIKKKEYENQLAYQDAADRGETIKVEEPTKNR